MVLCCVMLPTTILPEASAFGSSSYLSSKVIGSSNNSKDFPVTRQQRMPSATRQNTRMSLFNNNDREETASSSDGSIGESATTAAIWSPGLRKIMAGFAGLGALETGYLTYSKLANQAVPSLFCGSSQSAALSCDQVLNGPYSNLPVLENVPLAAVGVVAYSSVVVLALWPLLGNQNDERGESVDDTQNRILLTALTTAMGTFSIFLMTLLFGVLRATCPYCVFSAADSFLLTNLALIGGCLPEGARFAEEDDDGDKIDTAAGKTVFASFAGAVVGAVLLFGSGSLDAINNSNPLGGGSSSLLAAATTTINNNGEKELLYMPPEITTESSERALSVAKTLKELDAKMYGAHWCSHCYDQKQTLGKQVFDKQTGLVEYIECSKDGVNARTKVCKAKEIPGYPTWEINGKLYPGEQNLEELEELVKDIRSNGGSSKI